ncbi:MAG: tRNA delta(2)-isopentenylpyrophosphate transferase [Caulobacteraceae bacterium]|nr:tRNA delta(2)-isopentenylpyrophosphate transferase [Caulobacteraceae bacterium]
MEAFVSLPPITLIGGPTASGKTALALRLARECGAEIVNADSQQIYADLCILTARPTPEEQAQAPHHLFGVADAAEAWSTGRWLRKIQAVLAGIGERGNAAIIVGGTGLYFHALTKGLADIPLADRGPSETIYDSIGEAAFRRELADLDPAAEARIHPADRQRLVRAHAVATQTGRSLTDWQVGTVPLLAAGSYRGLVLEPTRDSLHRRIAMRLDAMVEAGALAEVAALMARGLDPELPAMKAVGLRELAQHLAGETNFNEAMDFAIAATRQYAKRQSTWFRNQTHGWERVAL